MLKICLPPTLRDESFGKRADEIHSSFLHNQKRVPSSNRQKLPISMTKKRRGKPEISSLLRGELQGLVAVFALDVLMKGSELKVNEQHDEVGRFFLGHKKQG